MKFLDRKHGEDWAIWEFRAEGTGYPDSEVYGRIHHYPWPDHHPPPFALVPNIMASMRNWLQDPLVEKGKRVVVVHCKAGKGRSGTVASSYLISHEGWEIQDALRQFTERRMRVGFGSGVSIPSQLRWINYVDLWNKAGKTYIDRPVEVLEIHAWGLRDGVKVAIQCYIEEGRKIKTLHVFRKEERNLVDSTKVPANDSSRSEVIDSGQSPHNIPRHDIKHTVVDETALIDEQSQHFSTPETEVSGTEAGGKAVIFRPTKPILVPSSDICIDLERRNRAPYGWTMVSAVAHVWFNTFFEGMKSTEGQDLPSASNRKHSGVFEIGWEALDGIKGTSRKGIRALDKIAIVWRDVGDKSGDAKVIVEPAPGEHVPETHPADWQGNDTEDHESKDKRIGLRNETPDSANVSRANSVRKPENPSLEMDSDDNDSLQQVKTHGIEE